MRGRLELRISPEISLVHDPYHHEGKTSGMDKGLFLSFRGVLCAGESAGFGLPVWKTKQQTFFPCLSSVERIDSSVIEKTFRMDRVLVWYMGLKKAPAWFSRIIEGIVEEYMKRVSSQHRLLRLREVLFPMLRIRNEVVAGEDKGQCLSRYETGIQGLRVHIDASSLEGQGRLVVLNECDGRDFTRLKVGNRLLQDSEIPAWGETTFEAAFESPSLDFGMSLSPGEGEDPEQYTVFCGREVGVGLNWTGLAITCRKPAFTYRMRFYSPIGI